MISNFLTRDTARLSSDEFDLLVIGGGINGVAVAWEAALRGLRVALVEKGDFGGEASAGCFKIIHSGVRYLQHLDLMRLRESVVEQRILRQIASPYVHPLPFLIPCYGWGMKGKPLLNIGMRLFEALSFPRNKGVDSYHFLPNHQLLTREQTLSIAPHLNQQGLTGGVVYYDCQMSNCERLTWSVARAAIDAGAVVCNYVELISGSVSKDEQGKERIQSVTLQDKLSGKNFSLKTKFIVNAAGPWLGKVLQRLAPSSPNSEEQKHRRLYTKGLQFAVPQFVNSYGVAVESRGIDEATVVSRGARSYFIFPWRDHSLVGTTDELVLTDPDTFVINAEEVEAFRREVVEAYPDAILKNSTIKFAFGGYRPVDRRYRADEFEQLKERDLATPSRDDLIVYHGRQNFDDYQRRLSNVISAEGMKYTTFRHYAEQIVKSVVQWGGFKVSPSKSATTNLPGVGAQSYYDLIRYYKQQYAQHFSGEVLDNMVREYGTFCSDLMAIADKEGRGAELIAGSRLPGAAVIYSIRYELAQTLSDIIFRRSGLGTLGYPGEQTIKQVAQIMADELGWAKERMTMEIQNLHVDFAKHGVKISSL
ncbi:MAG: glycerol-3-phosphate dehydrogenase/oxidase [Deltaproteobacteria bacterium]|nr:glycerol-3-phosphate dehydrogenase/oxidase [Deltaproteobacteria bacterium]